MRGLEKMKISWKDTSSMKLSENEKDMVQFMKVEGVTNFLLTRNLNLDDLFHYQQRCIKSIYDYYQIWKCITRAAAGVAEAERQTEGEVGRVII